MICMYQNIKVEMQFAQKNIKMDKITNEQIL